MSSSFASTSSDHYFTRHNMARRSSRALISSPSPLGYIKPVSIADYNMADSSNDDNYERISFPIVSPLANTLTALMLKVLIPTDLHTNYLIQCNIIMEKGEQLYRLNSINGKDVRIGSIAHLQLKVKKDLMAAEVELRIVQEGLLRHLNVRLPYGGQ